MFDIDHTRQHRANRRQMKCAARGVVLAALVLAAPGSFLGKVSAASPLTGRLVVSATSVKAGTPFTVTEEATNLGSVPLSGIKTAISHPPFTVVGHVAPRTVLGGCRQMQAWLYCLGARLDPHETQTNTYTLVANTPGVYTIQGQTVQIGGSIAGFGGTATITITK